MNEPHSRSIGRTILAVLVLVVAGYFLLPTLVGWLITIIVVVLAVVAVIWALRILL